MMPCCVLLWSAVPCCGPQAHRLKNDSTLTNRALDSLPCKRRVLLSGTPMQNHLDEVRCQGILWVLFCSGPGGGGPTGGTGRRGGEGVRLREHGCGEGGQGLGQAADKTYASWEPSQSACRLHGRVQGTACGGFIY
jgi:hypothetical protein